MLNARIRLSIFGRSQLQGEVVSEVQKKRWKTRHLIFWDDDVDRFWGLLTSTFAGLRIVEGTREWHAALKREPQVIYRDRLSTAGNPTDLSQAVWLEPEGWQPAYRQKDPSRSSPIVLENPPSVEFHWCRPHLLGNSWFHEDGPWRLVPAQISARLTDGDLEHRKFINAVWRMIGKLSTNKTPWHYHAPEGEIRGPYVDNMMWIGYGALDWVRQDPRRCFMYCHRPSDSI